MGTVTIPPVGPFILLLTAVLGLWVHRALWVAALVAAVALPKAPLGALLPWLMTGESFDAATAQRIGLVSADADADASLEPEMAAVRAGAPGALRAVKRLARTLGGVDVESALRDMEALSAELFAGPEALEGMAAFGERRAPARLTVAVLSGTAGYIDAVGFLMLVGLFPAHVTGELVGITTALTGGHHVSHASRFAVIPIFVGALLLAAVVTRARRRAGHSPRPTLLALMTGSLVLCTLSGFLSFVPQLVAPEWVFALREACVVSAMAFQNAFTREAPTSACPTTVMTGNLTHFVFELVEAVFNRLRPPDETHARLVPKSRLKLVSTALAAFAGGALLGGYLVGPLGAFSFAVPTVTALGLWRRVARET